MKEKMKIFTIESGDVSEGVKVDSFTLKGARVTIPAIIVGEEGRGRKLGILPVQLLPEQYKEWKEKGCTHIHSAEVGTTKAGKPKLFQTEEADTVEKCICIFRTKIGFRGSNSHTGDRKEEYWTLEFFSYEDVPRHLHKERYTREEVQEISEKYVTPPEKKGVWRWDAGFEKRLEFHPFPGEIICTGIIAQGDAGRMGSGEQLVAILPADTVFRTGYSGRLYGQPAAHYYIFTNGQLLAATWEEREISEIF